jgi:hypothetical protein
MRLLGDFIARCFVLQRNHLFFHILFDECLSDHLLSYRGFTDIEFNLKKSINCQAYSAALYVSLRTIGVIQEALESPEMLLNTLGNLWIF